MLNPYCAQWQKKPQCWEKGTTSCHSFNIPSAHRHSYKNNVLVILVKPSIDSSLWCDVKVRCMEPMVKETALKGLISLSTQDWCTRTRTHTRARAGGAEIKMQREGDGEMWNIRETRYAQGRSKWEEQLWKRHWGCISVGLVCVCVGGGGMRWFSCNMCMFLLYLCTVARLFS